MINNVLLMGRLTRDPELRHTDSGKAVVNFNIAVDSGWGEKKKTDFINCVAWNKTAEFIEKYFIKGQMIAVVGRISTRTWEGQDGKKNYATDIIVSEVAFADGKKEKAPEAELEDVLDDDGFVAIDTQGDMPF